MISNRHAAEKLFNKVLHDFREEILSSVVENWEQLTKIEKQQMTRMNNFFCGLHYLVGLAESTDKTLSMWEFSLLSDNSTQTLVCTACKAFKMSSWIACDVMKEKSCSKQLDLLLHLLRRLRQGGKR